MFVATDSIQVVFHLGRKVIIDIRAEMFFEQSNDGERSPARNQRVALLEYILAILNRIDNRCVVLGRPMPRSSRVRVSEASV